MGQLTRMFSYPIARRGTSRVSAGALPLLLLSTTLILAGCGDDGETNVEPVADGGTPTSPAPVSGDTQFRLQPPESLPTLVEGGDAIELPIDLARAESFSGDVLIEAEPLDDTLDALTIEIADATLGAGDSGTVLRVGLGIGMAPLAGDPIDIVVRGVDGGNRASETVVTLPVTPTERPDVYLLIGQSNMVGFSGAGTKFDDPGEPDAPVEGILQLNVTGNDRANYPTRSAFTDPDLVAVDSPRYILASDPLHDGQTTRTAGKEGDYVGLGLTFAKTAKTDTTADIVLVPAAWSDSGFCRRDSLPFTDMGWLPEPTSAPAFSGTLLFDRALARVTAALEETDGVLRGILWHQGEADAGDEACANAYAGNLAAMVEAFRTRIPADARGASARGPDAPVPFVAGTMSRGAEQADFWAWKETVDAVHRSIGELLPFASVVLTDDLVPPAYGCGEPNCIHFGADSYREMGRRYYQELGVARDDDT